MLISVSLSPHTVEFNIPRSNLRGIDTAQIRINDTPKVFDIEHTGGRIDVEVSEGRLSLGLEPTVDLRPSLNITASYHRVGDLYYPELLIPVSGFVEVNPRA